ncbi:hypothetical protein E2C01_016313 [Portunus trituberculatus]|uniref:Uncharacterized protein n=1 Tax=Portunus trituberculatus TaxID=210409 RepID=A0A5B7DQL0_PORTR|nr:hypothetical protein [Portunus trituberculatus]
MKKTASAICQQRQRVHPDKRCNEKHLDKPGSEEYLQMTALIDAWPSDVTDDSHLHARRSSGNEETRPLNHHRYLLSLTFSTINTSSIYFPLSCLAKTSLHQTTDSNFPISSALTFY